MAKKTIDQPVKQYLYKVKLSGAIDSIYITSKIFDLAMLVIAVERQSGKKVTTVTALGEAQAVELELEGK